MGWLERIFGHASAPAATPTATATAQGTIPPERMGLNGEYDQSGLAKRVAKAFDDDPELDDISTLWVAQTGSTVVLKGKVPNQEILKKMVAVAKGVKGTAAVDTTNVTIGT